MVVKSDQLRVKALLTEAITVLCKSGLSYNAQFCVEGLLGITLDDNEVFLVNINETVKNDRVPPPQKRARSPPREASPNECTDFGSKHTSIDSTQSQSDVSERVPAHLPFSSIQHSPSHHPLPYSAHSKTHQQTPKHKINLHARQSNSRFGSPTSSQYAKSTQGSSNSMASRVPHLHDTDTASEPPAKKQAVSQDTQEEEESKDVLVIKEEVLSDSEFDQSQTSFSESDRTALEPYEESSQFKPQDLPGCSSWEESASMNMSPSQALVPASSVPQVEDQPTLYRVPSIDPRTFYYMIALCILKIEGSFISARVVRRRHQRFTTDHIVNAMKMMSRRPDSNLYIGEYRYLKKKIQVFYKCPPQMVSEEALKMFGMSESMYRDQYYKSARPAKGGPFDWDTYYRIVSECAPFPLPESEGDTDIARTPNGSNRPLPLLQTRGDNVSHMDYDGEESAQVMLSSATITEVQDESSLDAEVFHLAACRTVSSPNFTATDHTLAQTESGKVDFN